MYRLYLFCTPILISKGPWSYSCLHWWKWQYDLNHPLQTLIVWLRILVLTFIFLKVTTVRISLLIYELLAAVHFCSSLTFMHKTVNKIKQNPVGVPSVRSTGFFVQRNTNFNEHMWIFIFILFLEGSFAVQNWNLVLGVLWIFKTILQSHWVNWSENSLKCTQLIED